MIADCCKQSRSSRQVRRIRYTRADVRYVCAEGHGCKVVKAQPKTTRNKAAGSAQQKNSQPLQAAATPCKTTHGAEMNPAPRNLSGTPIPTSSDQSSPRRSANHHG